MPCPICFSSSDLWSVHECGHAFCIKCSVRLVYLVNDKKCPLCLKDNQLILFSDDPRACASSAESTQHTVQSRGTAKSGNVGLLQARLSKLALGARPLTCEKENVFFASEQVKAAVESILAFGCRLCDAVLDSLARLKEHYKGHKKLMCNECLEHRKAFPSEFEVFDYRGLKEHKARGDGSFKGHVWCTFCSMYFYDAEDARMHCIKEHELCVFCARKRFYKNFGCLEQHWEKMHYTCSYPSCKRLKVHVFQFKGELMLHLKEIHSVNEFKLEDSFGDDLEYMDPMVKEITWFSDQENRPQGRSTQSIDTQPTPAQSSAPRKVASESLEERPVLPVFLDRSSLLADRSRCLARQRFLKSKTPYHEVVDSLLDRLNLAEISTKQVIAEMGMLMGQRDVYTLLNSCMCFASDKKALTAALKVFKAHIDFPKYKSQAPPKSEPKKQNKVGYKVLDLTKK